MSELTYLEVGASGGDLPRGYHHLRESRRIGDGRAVFEVVSSKLLSWGMHEGAGVRMVAGPSTARPGADVTFAWHLLKFDCRVISVVEEADRRGFTYGTLPRHPERGEERFMVTFDEHTQIVEATITAFSKPANPLVQTVWPLARLIQCRMARCYLNSLAEHC